MRTVSTLISLKETQKKLEFNAATVRKETAILAQQASLCESASSFEALRSDGEEMILTPASSAVATMTSNTAAGPGSAEDDTTALQESDQWKASLIAHLDALALFFPLSSTQSYQTVGVSVSPNI
ncbi:hypothetical protein EC991_006291 [Linnemannia zychae]|nr:hypothetical protein EC991_006291 [Linnemannia zychae]